MVVDRSLYEAARGDEAVDRRVAASAFRKSGSPSISHSSPPPVFDARFTRITWRSSTSPPVFTA